MKFVLSLLLPLFHAWDFVGRSGAYTNYQARQDPATYTGPPPQCNATPVHAELVARHGSRFATTNQVSKLTALQKKLKSFNSSTPAWLRNWVVPSDVNFADMVTPFGEQQHYQMGKRLKQTYPALFAVPYNPNRYLASSTFKARTTQSGTSYLFGALEGTGTLGASNFIPPYVVTNSPTTDTILRFFDTCPYYTSNVINVYDPLISNWANTNLVDVIASVQSAVGNSINVTDVLYMWLGCNFEVSLQNTSSIMCSLFNDTSAATMDVYSQLQGWYEKGPGVNLSVAIAAPLVVDILTSMQNFVTAGSKLGNPVNLRFAHAETISPLAAYLGLFAGGPAVDLAATPSSLFTRQWDDSNVIPLGANILFLMYECSDGFYVKMHYNEKETQIPGCADLYCPWSTFSTLYPQAKTFNFDSTCNPTLVPTTTPSLAPTLTPTVAPSLVPTVAPSLVPTVAPSLVSTVAPSLTPTSAPSSSTAPTPVCVCNKVSAGALAGPSTLVTLLLLVVASAGFLG